MTEDRGQKSEGAGQTIRELYIIGGSNGAGKTTFAKEFLPNYVHCPRFVNPDLIAAGLSPFDPASVAARAGRLIYTGQSFAKDEDGNTEIYNPVLYPALIAQWSKS